MTGEGNKSDNVPGLIQDLLTAYQMGDPTVYAHAHRLAGAAADGAQLDSGMHATVMALLHEAGIKAPEAQEAPQVPNAAND